MLDLLFFLVWPRYSLIPSLDPFSFGVFCTFLNRFSLKYPTRGLRVQLVLWWICWAAAGAGCPAWVSPWLPPTETPWTPHCQHLDTCTLCSYNRSFICLSLVNNVLEMWKGNAGLNITANWWWVVLEANVAFCFLMIPCQTGFHPQSSAFLMNHLAVELIQDLFLKHFWCFLPAWLRLHRSGFMVNNNVVMKSWNKVIWSSKCEKVEFGTA